MRRNGKPAAASQRRHSADNNAIALQERSFHISRLTQLMEEVRVDGVAADDIPEQRARLLRAKEEWPHGVLVEV